MTVKEMIERIRSSVHDKQEVGYTDRDLVGYINDGIRFLRRTVMSIAPMMLADINLDGILEAGENKLETEKPISLMVDVRADGRKLEAINPLAIYDIKTRGKPDSYYMVGNNTIVLYPVPDCETDYSVIAVSDMEMVDEKGESPFNNDLNDFVFEYALIRASLGNEFDMSQETSVMGTIVSQVEFMLENRVPKAVDVEGYWNRPVRSHTDYRGRYW